MVSIKAHQASGFMSAPPKDLAAVLFYGSDAGLVSERSLQLAKVLAAREQPPGEVARLDDTDLEEDSGRLAVELQTRPMFSGRKIIRAVAGRRIAAMTLKPLFSQMPFEGVLIVEAGNLKPDDAIRALFEKHADAVAVACYADSAADIDQLIHDVLAKHDLKIEYEARSSLASRLGSDRAVSRGEIEKLALFCLGRSTITIDDVDAIVGDAADLGLERIAEAAAQGKGNVAVSDFGRALGAGENAQGIIAITQRYFLKLHRVRSEIDAGSSLDEALRSLRPPLHFKQRDSFSAEVRRWSRASLDQALMRISEASRTARLSSDLDDLLGERLLLALSALATSSQGASGAARRR